MSLPNPNIIIDLIKDEFDIPYECIKWGGKDFEQQYDLYNKDYQDSCFCSVFVSDRRTWPSMFRWQNFERTRCYLLFKVTRDLTRQQIHDIALASTRPEIEPFPAPIGEVPPPPWVTSFNPNESITITEADFARLDQHLRQIQEHIRITNASISVDGNVVWPNAQDNIPARLRTGLDWAHINDSLHEDEDDEDDDE